VSSGPAVPERDALLATKLHVPYLRPGFVPRPRLAEQLDEGLARGLVLVCAPAGYGKTALLGDWIRRGEHPVAWLCLDLQDNDPARFWRHVLAALDRACPAIGERIAPLLGPPAGNRGIWCWRACCWPRAGLPGRWGCWTGCTRRRPLRPGSAA
jgi:LuxR family maltose regulon positive regulatory protein